MKHTYDIHALLSAAVASPALSQSIKFFLDWSPEIKHEGLVCTHLSAHLRSQGVFSRREVSMRKRRVDLEIGDACVEAKYHFEGDLLEIEARLAAGEAYAPKGWNSAPNAILSELTRGKASYFLWHVCIRSLGMPHQYKYAELIDKFYIHTGTATLPDAADSAEAFIDGQLFPRFKVVAPQVTQFTLPRIDGAHSCLISRLYYFPTRDEA